MNNNILHVGLDVGSTTVKIIVMNDKKETIYKDYQRHYSDTKNTVCNVLEKLNSDFPNSEFGKSEFNFSNTLHTVFFVSE